MRSSGLVALLVIGTAIAQDKCTTTTGKRGTCVTIKQCKPLLKVLSGTKPLSEASLDLLRSSQCGFENTTPKVCCQQQIQTTPSSNDAQVDVNSPPDVSKHPNLRLLDQVYCGPRPTEYIFLPKTGVFEYPWLALISYDVGQGKKEFRCGGSILNKRYILTAAHCVTSLQSQVKLSGVRVGEHNLTTERDCNRDYYTGVEYECAEKYQDFGIESYHAHPNYKDSLMQNDIALIRVDSDINFNVTTVKPVCMPVGPAAKAVFKEIKLFGWGVRQYDSPRYNELLREWVVPVVPLSQCTEAYRNLTEITYRQTCISARDGKDSCFGDSGGPMVVPGYHTDGTASYIQFGVESFGLSTCAIEGWPKVYTRADYYLDWILDTIRE